MKDLKPRIFSGVLYIAILIASLFHVYAFYAVFFILGLLSLLELNKLIQVKKNGVTVIIFSVLYLSFVLFNSLGFDTKTVDSFVQILLVTSIFVNLLLIKDLFSEKKIPLFDSKKFILTTFYLSSAFVFLIFIANYSAQFDPIILLGTFILIWINDTFAYLVGSQFGKQKLFESISPKKTVEGFLGGLFFTSICSYFIALSTNTFTFTEWLILAIVLSVFGTIGDLIESKFKRQANIKDSGSIMPGHGGLLDRLDSLIFAAPFVYLLIRIFIYVS